MGNGREIKHSGRNMSEPISQAEDWCCYTGYLHYTYWPALDCTTLITLNLHATPETTTHSQLTFTSLPINCDKRCQSMHTSVPGRRCCGHVRCSPLYLCCCSLHNSTRLLQYQRIIEYRAEKERLKNNCHSEEK